MGGGASAASSTGADGTMHADFQLLQDVRLGCAELEKLYSQAQPLPQGSLIHDLAQKVSRLAQRLLQEVEASVRPEEMASPDQVTARMKERQRREPEQWTMEVKDFFVLNEFCQQTTKYQEIQRAKRFVSMYDVNDNFVKRWTAGTGCSAAVLMSREKEQRAQIMISHAWGEDVQECTEAFRSYQKAQAIADSAAVWFCVYSNYQPGDAFGPSIPEQLQQDPFGSVIASKTLKSAESGFGMVALHTSREDLYCRLWCVYEVASALREADVAVNASMSGEHIQAMAAKVRRFASHGYSFDESVHAANIRADTIKASCSNSNDENMIIAAVRQRGGFDDLDRVITKFRLDMLPGEVYVPFIQQNPELLANAGKLAKAHREVAMAAVQQNGLNLKDVSAELKADKEIVLAAVQHNGLALMHASEDLTADKGIVLAAVAQNMAALPHASADLRKNREMLLAAVRQNAWSLSVVSEEFKADREIVLAAVQQCGQALRHASEKLQADREIVLAAVQQDWSALDWADFREGDFRDLQDKVIDDREIMLTAVQQNWRAVEQASGALKADRAIMLAVVQQCGVALQYASVDIIDREVLLAAVRQDWRALQVAGQQDVPLDVQADREIVLAAVQQDWSALQVRRSQLAEIDEMISSSLKADKTIMLAAVRQSHQAFDHASADLKVDREIVLAAVQGLGAMIRHVSAEFRADREIVLAAVRGGGRFLEYASEELKADQDIVLAAVQQDGLALMFASADLTEKREIVLAAVQQCGLALKNASAALKEDKEIVLAAVKEAGLAAMEQASAELRSDKEIGDVAISREMSLQQQKEQLLGPKMGHAVLHHQSSRRR